jgi:hypothetical protein
VPEVAVVAGNVYIYIYIYRLTLSQLSVSSVY